MLVKQLTLYGTYILLCYRPHSLSISQRSIHPCYKGVVVSSSCCPPSNMRLHAIQLVSVNVFERHASITCSYIQDVLIDLQNLRFISTSRTVALEKNPEL